MSVLVERDSVFLVVDRGGPGTNCDEVFLNVQEVVLHYPAGH
jgi:hypothetical protein